MTPLWFLIPVGVVVVFACIAVRLVRSLHRSEQLAPPMHECGPGCATWTIAEMTYTDAPRDVVK